MDIVLLRKRTSRATREQRVFDIRTPKGEAVQMSNEFELRRVMRSDVYMVFNVVMRNPGISKGELITALSSYGFDPNRAEEIIKDALYTEHILVWNSGYYSGHD